MTQSQFNDAIITFNNDIHMAKYLSCNIDVTIPQLHDIAMHKLIFALANNFNLDRPDIDIIITQNFNSNLTLNDYDDFLAAVRLF